MVVIDLDSVIHLPGELRCVVNCTLHHIQLQIPG